MHLPSPQEEAPQIQAVVRSSTRPEETSSTQGGRQGPGRSRSGSVSRETSSYGAYRASGSQYDVSRVLDSPIDEEFSAQVVDSPNSILQGDYFVRKSAFLGTTSNPSQSTKEQATPETAQSSPSASGVTRRQTLREKRVTSSPPKNSQFHFRSNSDVGLSRVPSLSNSLRSVKSYSTIGTSALLSSIAEAFREHISLKNHVKDSLEYKDSFTGQEAIDTLCKVIPTKDRGMAFKVGRALDSQKLFHDVTYEHRLRDSPDELYVFRESAGAFDDNASVRTNSSTPHDKQEVSGVFTQLTGCYSPTCSPNKLCYCSFCPQRMEQQARMSILSNASLERSDSRTSTQEKQKRQELWIESVPKEISDSLSKSERKRQEIIFELIYTEKDFVNDLELLKELYITPLRYGPYIEPFAREPFVRDVFYNINEIHNVSAKLGRALGDRQDEQPVIDQIGDIFLNHVKSLKPFVIYGGHQVYSKHRLEVEVKRNPKLAKFLEERERLPELRKLPIHSFLARPTTRLGRYPLLLEGVIKSSPEGHADIENLTAAISVIKECLSQINAESGKADNRLRLTKLNDTLVCKDGESKDLRLLDESRQLIRDGVIKKKSGVEQVELTMFLFDHMLLLTKKKKTRDGDRYEYRVHKKPIPLELLSFSSRDESVQKSATRRSSSSFLGKSTSAIATPKYMPDLNKGGYPLVITHLGRNGMSLTLYAANQADRKEWEEKIEQQRDLITRKTSIFEMSQLSDSSTFGVTYKITCSTTYSYGQKVAIGAEDGIYVGANGIKQRFRKVIDIEKVSQIAILEDFNLLLVLSDKMLVSYPLEVLESSEMVGVKRARKVTSHVSFFEVGVCVGRTLVCAVKSTAFSSTVKTYEPIQASVKPKKNSLGRLLIRNGIDGMKIYKEFYIPTESSSVHFLKSKLCVGCAKGFEVVDLATLSTQCLLDPFDENLNFVTKKENARPIDIFRLKDGDFILCYDEFAFYVNKNGRRARPSWLVNWEGNPASFALQYPYVLAFDPTFIEVRHVDTGNLEQVIPCRNLRKLNVDSNAIHCVANTFMDYQCVFSIKYTKEAVPTPTPVEPNNSQLERRASNPARYCYS
ncbi:CNH-domain-containing protein [Basidiobolus meristosporus CBS 931.73]|uniref:CNH-domain-containing protein n=1 Tax=Basidiobolus meristosporus CBS 931.73 TaxID=1314790 RepID=A0A1Y1XMX6_9FUNG|nr:CNH-domain-containing protein [Basidiobolus meristosporus CBS 931.73]|eukprot:ORX87091.1 CNH-domain-containing protein [Basidiobolus meristosporus CBS 931.73]